MATRARSRPNRVIDCRPNLRRLPSFAAGDRSAPWQLPRIVALRSIGEPLEPVEAYPSCSLS